MADDIHAAMTWLPTEHIKVIKTESIGELLRDLAACKQEVLRFDLILAIAHSNRDGLSLTKDGFAPWKAFVNWIKPFNPKHLVFAACEAGHPWSVEQLFKGLSTLQEIYAPPLKTTKEQAVEIIKALIPAVLWKAKNRDNLIRLIQAINLIARNGCVFRWTRREFSRGNVTPKTWEFVLQIFGQLNP